MRIMGAGMFLDKILRQMFLSRKKIVQNGYNCRTLDWETEAREKGTPPPLSFAPVLSGRPPPPHPSLPLLSLPCSQSIAGVFLSRFVFLLSTTFEGVLSVSYRSSSSRTRHIECETCRFFCVVCFCFSLFLQSYTSPWGRSGFWDMTSPCSGSPFADNSSRRSHLRNFFPVACLLCLALFTGTAFLASDYKEKFTQWGRGQMLRISKCENLCRPPGSETLPRGIVASSSDLEMRPLWTSTKEENITSSANLFAMAVGVKQKDLVNKMVVKFLTSSFAVILFHYDGAVDEWKDFEWYSRVIHVAAAKQTKWWFAKRFLHPDIVAEYNYIFLWDEDLGVEHFQPKKYISIVESEGLEISQPALDPVKSEVHHRITARLRNSNVHRRTYRTGGPGEVCNDQSTAPPCTGWIEMMAPVFSRAAWRCVWYMIQNDLIYAWGLDMQLGYCAQGDRTKNVGIVDAEYVVHYNRPTLGGPAKDKASSESHKHDPRVEVRRQSYTELTEFNRRWRRAIMGDRCWVDPYPQKSL